MISPPIAEPIPMTTDADGVIRVGGTRVTLESFVATFRHVGTPADMMEAFPTLKAADVYALIAYLLNHEAEIDAYMREQDALAEQTRREVEARNPALIGLKERLLARLAAKSDPDTPSIPLG